MAVYLALCLFLCLGSVLWARELGFSNGIADEKRTARLQWTFLLLSGGLFVLMATMRYGIGYDYFNYERLYEQLGPMTAAQLVQDPVGKQFIGYSLVTHLLYRAGLDYRSLLLVINLLMTGVVLWFVKRYSPLPWMSLFFYLTLQFFAHSMNLFRQSIAATICLLAYPFLKRRKLLPFVLVVLLAAAFHTSALFFLPFYWILNWKCDGRLLGGLALAAVPVYLFSNRAAQLVTQYLFPNYAGYIGSRYWAGLGYRYAIFPILYFAAAWLTRRWLLAERQENRILINSSFYVMLLYVFSTHHMILERFSIYLFPYAMLLLPKMVVSVPAVQGESKKKESKRLERQRRERMVLLAVLAVAAGFAYLCFASMQGTNGFHKVYPYVSVWS